MTRCGRHQREALIAAAAHVQSARSLDVVQASSVMLNEAPSHPLVTFGGTTTYDASFLGAQNVGLQQQAQPASSAHALPDAPFESSTEYSQVRPGCCGASASMSGKDTCVLPQVRTLCTATDVTCTRMQARDMRHTNTHDLQRYRGTPTPAEGAAFAPCKGASHPIVPLESTTTYGVDYGPHRKGAHGAQARARLQKTLPTGGQPMREATRAAGCVRSRSPVSKPQQYSHVENPHKCALGCMSHCLVTTPQTHKVLQNARVAALLIAHTSGSTNVRFYLEKHMRYDTAQHAHRLATETIKATSYTLGNCKRDPRQPVSTWSERVPIPSAEAHHLDMSTTYGTSFVAPVPGRDRVGVGKSEAAHAWTPNPNSLSSATTYRDAIEASTRTPHRRADPALQAQQQEYPGLHAGALPPPPTSTYSEAFARPAMDAPSAPDDAALGSGGASTARGAVHRKEQPVCVPIQHKLEGPSVYATDYGAGKNEAGKLRCDNVWMQLQPNPFLHKE